MAKVVTFGELMLRLAPNHHNRFFQNDQMQATFGGAEANVAVSLANYGMDSVYVTKLPKHAIGQAAVDSLRYFGVDTSKIVRGGDRVGIYFLEKGASQRGSACIYDRAYSAIQMASKEDFDWDSIFDGADWFHFTGITPALGENVAEICKEACETAKAKGVKISFDVNFRSKLWTKEKAQAVLTKFIPYADVCFANSWDAHNLLGVDVDENADFETASKAIAEKYDIEYVAASKRVNHSASSNDFSASIYSKNKDVVYTSKTYSITHIVDRVGTGDAFDGGLIYSILSGKSAKDAIEFAVAAATLKHSIEGDYNRVSVSEVEKLAGGDGSGRVQR